VFCKHGFSDGDKILIKNLYRATELTNEFPMNSEQKVI